MSGGAFNYNQYKMGEIAFEINVFLGSGYSPETLEKFKEAVETLNRAEIMAQRIDWLLSGDDDEDTFHKRWNEELEQLNAEDK